MLMAVHICWQVYIVLRGDVLTLPLHDESKVQYVTILVYNIQKLTYIFNWMLRNNSLDVTSTTFMYCIEVIFIEVSMLTS